MKKFYLTFALLAIVVASLASSALANHTWGNYHWERLTNPLSLVLGDHLTSAWDSYLVTSSNDWSLSSVLDTTILSGLASSKTCKPVLGRVEVCNSTYGKNGWLGIASIWVSGEHVTQGTVKMNDTYYKTAKYNTSAWKNLVMCQEIGHTFGLDHQDENFTNANLGTCMDYTNDPASNQHPNEHDYEMLESIYSQLDNSLQAPDIAEHGSSNIDHNDPSSWGKSISQSEDKRSTTYELDLGKGKKIFTFVVWAK